MDLIELIAQEMAVDDGPPGLGHFRQDSGLWYNEVVHALWLKRARAAHRVMKREMTGVSRVLPFLRQSQ